MTRLFRAIAASAALMDAAAADAPLSQAQLRLIQLLTYVQTARDRCGFLIDVDVLRLAARETGIDFEATAQRQARDEGFAAAERAFAGLRQSVECSYALQRYGPEGAEFKGLLERNER